MTPSATKSLAHVFGALVLTAGIGLAPASRADDAELYQMAGYEFGPDYYANVLFIIDTSGSMNNDAGDGNSRLDIVRDVVQQFLSELDYVNVGLMRFDSGYTPEGGDYVQGGGMVVNAVKDIATSRDEVIEQLNEFVATGRTPLSETLFEAALYMQGKDVYFGNDTYAGLNSLPPQAEFRMPSAAGARNGDTYISPAGDCQENHIVLLTDGLPVDDNGIDDVVTDWSGFAEACTDNPDVTNGDCLDDIAAYLYENDLDGDATDGFQNVTTHTIGFFQDNSLLAETAARGGGRYYLANDAESLLNTLESIFVDVNETGTTFTAPGVSVNAFDRTTHLDQLYYSVFQATGRASWVGNLKRYRLGEDAGGGLIVVDADDGRAVNEQTGFFREDSRSFWSDDIDGYSVAVGGAAAKLSEYRNTLTELGGVMTSLKPENAALVAHLDVLFDSTELQSAMTAGLRRVVENGDEGLLDVSEELDQIAALLDWARGKDIRDVDGDGNLFEARQRMGDPMHSRPTVVTYGAGEDEPQAVVFVGTNDGYLHAFRGETGEELSAFMPSELLPQLTDWFANVETADRLYGVDGPITAWVRDGGDGQVDDGDTVTLYVGLRRGGDHYYALDYTNPAAPTLLWKISSDTPGFAQLGQTWSPMTRTRVKTGTFGSTLDQDVLIFGGGYDERQDNYAAWGADTRGNAIYMVNAYTGELVWSGSAANVQDTNQQTLLPEMTNAITGKIRTLDLDGDGFVDRLYAADLGGRVWRLDVHNPDQEGEAFNVTGGVMASLGGAAAADAASNRRFYYAPDIALGSAGGRNFFNITVASGYRAHPKDTGITDHFYVLRDYYAFHEIGTSDNPQGEYVAKYGYTHDDMSDIATLQSDPDALVPGFKMALTVTPGEKVLSETRIFQNKATFSSYLPQNALTRGCFAALGRGQLYSIDLGTGGIGIDELDKPGIPPEVVYIFTEDDDAGYTPSTCFGDYCADAGEEEESDGEEQSESDDDRPRRSGRDIGCVIGTERCAAATREVPVKTWWQQAGTDN
jgi:type IV pilus assembly protein PilY1